MGLFKKSKAIDPADFLALRNELQDFKARLVETEQAKSSLEDRLSSLAATTMVLSSSSKSDTTEIVDKIETIESLLDSTLAVGAKVDELRQRVNDVESNVPSGVALGAELEPRFAALATRLEQVAELAAAPVEPDDQLASRLEHLARSAASVQLLEQQIAQINTRISAQAELADQLTALSDRIGLLQQRNVDSDSINQRLDELTASGSTEELSERLAMLASRIAATEEATRVTTETAASHAELSQQVAALESRLTSLHAERAQPADLDAHIGSLLATSPVTTGIEARLTEYESQLRAQVSFAERLADLDDRLAQIDERSADMVAIRQQVEQLSTAPNAGNISQQLGELAQRVAMTAEEARIARDRIEQLNATSSASNLAQRLDELTARAAATEADARHAREQAEALEHRIVEFDPRTLEGVEHRVDELASRLDAQAAVADQLAELWPRVIASEDHARVSLEQTAELAQQLSDSNGSRVHTDDRLGTLAARLDAQGNVAEQLNELWSRVTGNEEQTRAVREQAAALENRVAEANTMEIDRQLDDLRSQLEAQAQLPERLAQLDARLSQLPDRSADIDQLHQRISQVAASIPDTSTIGAQLSQLDERLVSTEGDARTARAHTEALDERIQSVSTELANQLGELSRDIDALAHLEVSPSTVIRQADDQALQVIRSGQVRLAAEQARYEISFREDLAMLAEQVRQLRGRA